MARADSAGDTISLTPLGSHATGQFDEGSAEIVVFDPATSHAFVVNNGAAAIDVIDFSNPSRPVQANRLSVAAYGKAPNSVALHGGIMAVAVEAPAKNERGKVVFFTTSGEFLKSVTVGYLPDMLTFTPDGRTLLVANEGEPMDDYSFDPEGSVSIIDLSGGITGLDQKSVREAGFAHLTAAGLDGSTRIFGPEGTVAQNLEPEYIAVSPDSRTAWVTLQENNALAHIDIAGARITNVTGLGFKDYSRPGNGIDASDKDDGISIATYPVLGMYQPDSIAAFSAGGKIYLITANEGDARDYEKTGGYSEETRVAKLTLDPAAFPDAAKLQEKSVLGRLKVTTANGDTDGDGDYDALYSYGARSFAIWGADGELVYDSGDALERLSAQHLPGGFNSDNDENGSFDSRSDDKGPEPEALAVGEAHGRSLAFVGLERTGDIVVVDIGDPRRPEILSYINTRDFEGDPKAGTAGDLGPEGIAFVAAGDSPTGSPLIIVANEVSGTTTAYEVTAGRPRQVGQR